MKGWHFVELNDWVDLRPEKVDKSQRRVQNVNIWVKKSQYRGQKWRNIVFHTPIWYNIPDNWCLLEIFSNQSINLSGWIFFPLTNFSSMTICAATIICAKIIIPSPINTFDKSFELPPLISFNKSDTPTPTMKLSYHVMVEIWPSDS